MSHPGVQSQSSPTVGSLSRYASMPRPVKAIFLMTNAAAIALFIFHWFAIPIGGRVMSGTFYYYLLFALLGFNVFMGLAAVRRQRGGPRWYDYCLSIALVTCIAYFLLNAEAIGARLWEPTRNWSWIQLALAILVCVISLEAGRRIGGWSYVGVVVVCGLYPLIADHMPGVLFGFPISFPNIMADFAYGANGLLGLPGHILGELILGYYVFSGVMVGLGGGEFFLKLAVALLGRYRGGPAKVSVIASGFFGSLSGNIMANIVGTGCFTIPAMKRMGYPAHYAGAIEACASTGGAIMPPILGGMAFTAAIISGIPYSEIMIASIIPALLYYFGLIVQVDAYAARTGFRGLPKSDVPAILPILKEGWVFLVVLAFLTVGLVYFRWSDIAPLYAVGLLFILAFFNKKTRPNWKRVEEALVQTSSLINFTVGIFISMGLILVGLFKTGMAAALTSWVVNLGASNIYLVLIVGTIFNLIMGMVGLQSTAQLFLAVTMAPAIVAMGHIPMVAAQLFIICFAILGGLTPPVAINAFVAASLAGAPPMKTAWTSCRLGIVLVFIPFFFIMQPALVMEGSAVSIVYHFVLALLGVYLVTASLEGYLVFAGKVNTIERLAIGLGGFMIALPELYTTIAGVIIAAIAIAIKLVRQRTRRPAVA